MRVLILGKNGQLGSELVRVKPNEVELMALGSAELDITSLEQVISVFRAFQPELIINAAAYTAVDRAEQAETSAYAVNRDGVKHLTVACKKFDARLFHVSTDFVFDGSASRPYQTNSVPSPVSVYGASKRSGEQIIIESMPQTAVIIRTAWVYSVFGNNFVKTMLRLMQEKNELSVVYDQVGTPTWAKGLALWLWEMANLKDQSGIFHWTDAGVSSWYDFAVAIQELALQKGLLVKDIPIHPIPSAAYPTAAKRPAYSVLDKTDAEIVSGMKTIHWRQQLSSMLDELV